MKRFFFLLILFSSLVLAQNSTSDSSCSAPVLSELTIPFWQFALFGGLFVIGAAGLGFGWAYRKKVLAGIGLLLLVASAGVYLLGPGFNFKTGFFVKDQHIHADIKAYLFGQAVNFSEDRFQSTDQKSWSGFIHFHDGNGNVIHLHASGVPLSYLFGSFGGLLNSTCIQVASVEPFYCSNSTDSLKFFVNGQPVSGMGSYQFHDLDRLLISYGPASQDVSAQLASVTHEACIPSGKCPVPAGYPTEESCSS